MKCIYIDPPYNTGNEAWIYNDNVSSPEILAWLGKVVGKETEDLSRHDKWLCMMYPRLRLLKELLAPEGAIFISIDDNEVHNLVAMMNEIFGVNKFVANVIWQKRTSRENRSAIGDSHDFIVVYAAAGRDAWKKVRNKLPPNDKGFGNPDNDPKGKWRSIPFSAQGFRENQMYVVETPTGKKLRPPKGRCWGATEPVFEAYRAEGRVYFPKNGNGRPRIKAYMGEEEGLVPSTIWFAKDVGDNERAKKEVLALFPDDEAFDTPKPEALMQSIIAIATNPGDIVLDSFLGSGTTAAVAMKMKRHFIGIETGTHAETVAGERLHQVVKGEDGGISRSVDWEGGSGSLKGYQTAALQSLRSFLDAVSSGTDSVAAFAAITRRLYVEPPQLPGLPYVCLRVPTGGGKTFMAAHTVGVAADAFLRVENPVVLWLVPSQAIRDQTLKTLTDREHANCGALRDRFGENVRVMTLAEALYAKRGEYDGSACIIVATIQAFRVEDKEGREVYDANGELMDHFTGPRGAAASPAGTIRIACAVPRECVEAPPTDCDRRRSTQRAIGVVL